MKMHQQAKILAYLAGTFLDILWSAKNSANGAKRKSPRKLEIAQFNISGRQVRQSFAVSFRYSPWRFAQICGCGVFDIKTKQTSGLFWNIFRPKVISGERYRDCSILLFSDINSLWKLEAIRLYPSVSFVGARLSNLHQICGFFCCRFSRIQKYSNLNLHMNH